MLIITFSRSNGETFLYVLPEYFETLSAFLVRFGQVDVDRIQRFSQSTKT